MAHRSLQSIHPAAIDCEEDMAERHGWRGQHCDGHGAYEKHCSDHSEDAGYHAGPAQFPGTMHGYMNSFSPTLSAYIDATNGP